MIFRQDLWKVLLVFLPSLSFFSHFSTVLAGPLSLSSLHVFLFSFHSSTLFLLKYSRGLHARVVWKGVSLQRGVVVAGVLIGFGGEEKSFIFSLYAFIPLLKCGVCLDARCSYPSTFFWLSLNRFFHVFLLVLVGLVLFLFFLNKVLQCCYQFLVINYPFMVM